MKTNELNHKLYLYKPSGAEADFLGELLVDNLQVDIRLHDISNISFTIPRVINGVPNPRIDQVLDNYIVELQYGRIDETYPDDYFKMRFVIYKTPMDFSDTKFIHSYQGSSTESLLEFKLINNWPGVEVYDFFRTITYNRADNNFDEGATEYVNQESNASTGQRYIRLQPVKPNGNYTVYPLDIFLYEIRKKTVVGEEVETKNALIEFNYAGKDYTHADFKVGYYYLSLNGDGTVQYIYIALPDNDVTYNSSTNNYLYNTFTSDYTFSYRLYDNPITKTYAIGPNSTDEANPLNDMYIDLATEADQGDLTPEYGTPQISYNSQKIYSKNGLTLRQILTGKTLESATTANKDGLLYDTDYTIGTIHADIEDLYRSNLQFNNITRLQAIKQVAESFKSFIVFDTIAKTMSFYPENEYGTNKGLILRYASYLKSLNKEVDSSKIITLATAIGKDKTTLNLINPTGKSYWEDYAYFLDSYFINTDDNDILTLISGGNLTLSIQSKRFKTDDRIDTSITHNALKVLYTGSTANFTNRWFSTTAQAKALGEWQFARDLYHEIMLGNIEPDTDLDGSLSFLQRYYNLYTLRDNEIKNYVKLETQLAEYEAAMYKSKYLYEYYKKQWDELTSAQQTTAISNGSQTWVSYNKYKLEFTAKTIELEVFKTDILNPIKDDLFGTAENPYGAADSTFRKLLEVQSALHRQSTATDSGFTTCLYVINPIESLNNFKRNAVNNDSSIDNELELLKSTKIYLDENKYPKITVNIDTASLISAEEARQDWNKSFIGDKLYVYLPELNVNLEVQVREVSIDFESNSMSLTISNVRNYNRTFGKFLTKIVRNLYNANQNITTYYQDQYNEGSKRANEDAAEKKEGQRFEPKNKSTAGAEDIDTGKSSVEVTGAGIEMASIDSVDEATQTFTLVDKAEKGLSNVDGTLVAYYDRGSGGIRTEVEISGDNGIIIKKIDNTTNVTNKQMYIDTNGNAIFNGQLVVNGSPTAIDTFRTGILDAVASDITDLQNQIDGAITSWFGDIDPVVTPTANYPVTEWALNEYTLHVGDLFYNTATGAAFRFVYTESLPEGPEDYSWVAITDTDVALALSNAAAAQATADSKVTIFYAANQAALDALTPEYDDMVVIAGNFTHSVTSVVYRLYDTYRWSDVGVGSWIKVQNVYDKAEGSVGGWTVDSTYIQSNNYSYVSGNFSTAGLRLNNNGSIIGQQFAIDSSGNAYFKGNITGASGTFSGNLQIGSGENVFKVDSNGIYLGNETFASAEFSVTPAGYLKASSGTVGGWTLGSNNLSSSAFELFSGASPYLSIAQATDGYNNTGIFLGIESSNPKLSLIKDASTFFKYDPSLSAPSYNLEISGNAKVGPLFLNNLTSSSTASFTSSDYTTSGTINVTSDSGSVTTSRTYTFTNAPFNLSSVSVTYTTSGAPSGYWTLYMYVRNGSNVIATYTRQSAAGTFTWTTTGINAVATNIYFELQKGGGTSLTFTLSNVTGVRFLESMLIEDFAVYPNGTVFSNRIQNKDLTLIDNNIETRDTFLNLKVLPTLIGGGGVAILNSGDTTRDGIEIQPSINYGSSSRRILITTPAANLSANRIYTLPDFDGRGGGVYANFFELSTSLGSTSISHSGAGDSTSNFTTITHTITSRRVYRITWSIASETSYITSYVSIDANDTTTYVPFSVQRSSGTGANAWFEYVGKIKRTSATTFKLADCFSHFYDASYENDDDIAGVTIHLREIELVSH